MKKTALILGVAVIAIGASAIFLSSILTTPPQRLLNPINYRCPFCDPRVRQSQIYHEGKHLMVMLNHHPLLEGHSMIVPKRHVVQLDELTPEEMVELGDTVRLVKKVFERVYNTSDYLFVLQNGVNAGQTVLHAHIHMIPRPEYNLLTKLWLWYVLLARPLQIYPPKTSEELFQIKLQFEKALENP